MTEGLTDEKSEELEDEGVAGDQPEMKILSTLEQVWPSHTFPSYRRPKEAPGQENRTTQIRGFRPSEPDVFSRNFQSPRVVEHLEFSEDYGKNTKNVKIFQNTIKSEPTSNSNPTTQRLTPRLTPRLVGRPDYQEGQTEDFSGTVEELQPTPDRAGYGKGQNENIFLNCP